MSAANLNEKLDRLIWIDLEMTGLDCDNDKIIEIATVVTDNQLEVIAEGPVIAIHQPEELLINMDDWNRRQHSESGLWQRVIASEYTTADAEKLTMEFLSQFVESNKSPMCGNSICQDRRFMARLMPRLEAFFHYRNLDVSTLKELAYRWNPDVHKAFYKHSKHLALSDIYDSINELKHYRQYMGTFAGLGVENDSFILP